MSYYNTYDYLSGGAYSAKSFFQQYEKRKRDEAIEAGLPYKKYNRKQEAKDYELIKNSPEFLKKYYDELARREKEKSEKEAKAVAEILGIPAPVPIYKPPIIVPSAQAQVPAQPVQKTAEQLEEEEYIKERYGITPQLQKQEELYNYKMNLIKELNNNSEIGDFIVDVYKMFLQYFEPKVGSGGCMSCPFDDMEGDGLKLRVKKSKCAPKMKLKQLKQLAKKKGLRLSNPTTKKPLNKKQLINKLCI